MHDTKGSEMAERQKPKDGYNNKISVMKTSGVYRIKRTEHNTKIG